MSDEKLVAGGLMRVKEAAEFLGLSRTTLYELMDAGRLRYVRFGRARRIPRAEVHRVAVEGLTRPAQGES